MEKKQQIDAIYTDLKAAFDRIDRELFLAKFSRLGATDRLICWMRSYLFERTLRVKLGDSSSQPFINSSGVPQGSNLGPLVFALYINDVCFLLPEGCRLLYADDLKIYLTVKSIEDCRLLQNLLNVFADWCFRNRICISIDKCSVITFSRLKVPLMYDYSLQGSNLTRVTSVRDLGVTLDTQMTFNVHREMVIGKANRQLGFVKRICNEFSDPLCFRSLYCALVRPILETASVVWGPYHDVWDHRIEQVQKRFVRYALRNLYWRSPENLPPYSERCGLLHLDTLLKRRRMDQAVFACKVLKAEIDSPFILSQFHFNAPERSLRPRELLFQPFHRSEYGQFEPIAFIRDTFLTTIQHYDFSDSTNTFRNKLKQSNLF